MLRLKIYAMFMATVLLATYITNNPWCLLALVILGVIHVEEQGVVPRDLFEEEDMHDAYDDGYLSAKRSDDAKIEWDKLEAERTKWFDEKYSDREETDVE